MQNQSSRAHIIAEAGVNHNGSFDNAIKLVDIAKASDADSVKFQIINPYGLYLPGDYEYGHYDIKDVIANRFSTVLSDDDYRKIKSHCDAIGIAFSASIFDEKGLDLLSSMNPPYIKIASCDLPNIQLLRQVAQRGIKMILSTGMSTLQEIEKSLNALAKVNFDDIVLLHCVSIYPCPLESTNIAFIETLHNEFGKDVGFSDHTRTAEAAVAAYTMGVRWFEKHFTYDNELPGFDHKHAQNEEEFTYYIKCLRDIEKSIGTQKTKLTDAEKYTAERARRSLYAAKDLKAGAVITEDDILCVRPSAEMNANQIDELIGRRLTKDKSQYSAFSLNDIGSD
ncbi:MAG: hypothetical protein HKN09_12965 [Saprospiraceae bacterium]|nr:hypothetical protein [Saprospiraceae bacterium]